MPRHSLSPTSSESDHQTKKPRLDGPGIFNSTTIFIIQTKIDISELELLYDLAESNGADVTPTVERADVIVTRISMRKRLERHLKWELAKQKSIVTPSWITHSVAEKRLMPCGQYAAVCTLEECAEKNCPDHNVQSGSVSPPPMSHKTIFYTARFAVQRLSPLVCVNQSLLEQLDVIRNARALEGEERSAMSYARSIAAIKAYPHRIQSPEQVAHLPFLGPKLLTMIREYTTSGVITESSRASNSLRYRCLSSFTRIHGIGPSTARKLYDAGCRTHEDLDRRFGSDYGQDIAPATAEETSGIRTILELRDDLSVSIPREEVEEICRVVAQELEAVEPGCQHVICGGYRRGKSLCSDIDIVFTHPQNGKDRGLCKRLVDHLRHKGLVTHVLRKYPDYRLPSPPPLIMVSCIDLSSFRSTHPFHSSAGESKPHWDTLDKSLAVFRLPGREEDATRRLHRRLDLICAPIETYWTAVVGWTGSTMFERDLRLWAKQKMGLKFDSSGITRRRDTKALFPATEHAVFEMLGLDWIDPTMRNADL